MTSDNVSTVFSHAVYDVCWFVIKSKTVCSHVGKRVAVEKSKQEVTKSGLLFYKVSENLPNYCPLKTAE